MTSGPDEEARIEADLLALVRAEYGYVPPDLDPEGAGNGAYDVRSAALIAEVLATPRSPRRTDARVRAWRRRAVLGAAGLVAASVAVGAVAWWPADDQPAPSRSDDSAQMALTPLAVTPPQGRDASQVLADLAERAEGGATNGSTVGKAQLSAVVTTVTWDHRPEGQVTVQRTVTSARGARVAAASSDAGVFTEGVLDPDKVAELAESATTVTRSVAPLETPARGTAQRLRTGVIALAPECEGEAAYCYALGLRTWAAIDVIDSGPAHRILAAIEGLTLEYAGSARDRLGREVEVFTVDTPQPGERLRMLFDRDTGRYLGDEVTTGERAHIVSATVIVESRRLEQSELPTWAQQTP